MALTQKLSNEAANAEVDAIAALMNGGFIDIYDGAQPATADTAITTQVLLATLTFGSPAFGAGVAGVAVANAIGDESDAPASGVAAWYRCWKANHTSPVMDGSVGTSGANLNLNTTTILQHANVSINAFVLTASKE